VVFLQPGLEGRAGNLVGRHVLVAGDRRQVRRVGALHRRGAVPRVQHVLRRDLVAVGERHVLSELERVGRSVRRDGRHAQRDGWDDVEVAVELQQAIEQVLCDLGFGLAVDHRGVEGADIMLDRKSERLIGGEAGRRSGAARSVRTRDEYKANERSQQPPSAGAYHLRLMSVPGRGRRRQEGGEKVTGSTRFTADLELPGLLHVHLVVAHTPRARIRGIETAAARSAPGVVDVITGRDFPELDSAGPDLPLAVGHVFYVGQPVVAVVAESEAAAADAAALVAVDYEESRPVVDASAAMDDRSPLVLDEAEAADDDDASVHGASAAADRAPEERP